MYLPFRPPHLPSMPLAHVSSSARGVIAVAIVVLRAVAAVVVVVVVVVLVYKRNPAKNTPSSTMRRHGSIRPETAAPISVMGNGQLLAASPPMAITPATADTSSESASNTNAARCVWNGPTVSFEICQKSISNKVNDEVDGWIIINHMSTKEESTTRPRSSVPGEG